MHDVAVIIRETLFGAGRGVGEGGKYGGGDVSGRGLHSFTFQLNVSAFCGTGGASRC